MKVWKRYLIMTCVSAVLGIITGSLFKSSYFDALKAIFDAYFDNIKNNNNDFSSRELIPALIKILTTRLRPFIILWLLSGVEFVRLFIAWLFAKWGYISGFVLCFAVMAYGGSAVVIIPAWIMPQILIYGASYFFSVMYIMCGFSRKKGIIITLLSLIMIAGCVCETYVNPMCIRLLL